MHARSKCDPKSCRYHPKTRIQTYPDCSVSDSVMYGLICALSISSCFFRAFRSSSSMRKTSAVASSNCEIEQNLQRLF